MPNFPSAWQAQATLATLDSNYFSCDKECEILRVSKMAEKDPIRTCCQELEMYFDASVPTSRVEFLARAAGAETEDVSFDFVYFKFPLPARLIRHFGRGYLNRAAARRWLDPHMPCLFASDITQLRHQLGLDDVEVAEFLDAMKQCCREVQRSHPQLRLWVAARIALLDFIADADDHHAPESVKAALLLRHRLLQVISYLYSLRPVALVAASAEELSAAALTAAGQELCLCLGTGPCEYNANLMVPIPFNEMELNVYREMAAAARAETVWSKCSPFDRCLIVAAETERAGHIGFWVPLARGTGGEYLAGAPRAFMSMSSTAVFKADLPDLVGFPPAVNDTWRSYMSDHFHQDLFVSVPFLVPGATGIGTKVACVLNVNVQSQDENWCRAYHREWLNIVTPRVAPFIEIALYATLVRMEAARRAGDASLRLRPVRKRGIVCPVLASKGCYKELRNQPPA